MASQPRILTPDDVLDLPLPDGVEGYELVDGEPVPVMPASFIHGELIVTVAARLHEHVRKSKLSGKVVSDAGFVLGLKRDRMRMRAPDVAYVSREKAEAQAPEKLFRGVPDFAVEIDLTSGKKPGGQQRIIDYLDAGVRLVWAIDPPSRTAIAYRPDGSAQLVREGGVLDADDVVSGFRLPLSDLFA